MKRRVERSATRAALMVVVHGAEMLLAGEPDSYFYLRRGQTRHQSRASQTDNTEVWLLEFRSGVGRRKRAEQQAQPRRVL